MHDALRVGPSPTARRDIHSTLYALRGRVGGGGAGFKVQRRARHSMQRDFFIDRPFTHAAIPLDMTDPRDHLQPDAGDVKAATDNPKFGQQQQAAPPAADDHLQATDEPTKPGSAHKVFE